MKCILLVYVLSQEVVKKKKIKHPMFLIRHNFNWSLKEKEKRGVYMKLESTAINE